jgi:hypothetical protein
VLLHWCRKKRRILIVKGNLGILNPFFHRTFHKPGLSLSVPPKLDKSPGITMGEDKRSTKAARANSAEDKLKALRQYRRARGLCDK